MIAENEQKLYDLFEQLGIGYTRHEHPPVYTVDEAKQYWQGIEGKRQFRSNSRCHAGGYDGEGKRGLETGAVSPFGLINDAQKAVKVVLDRDLAKAELVNFHPNVNTATVTLSYHDFEKFLSHCGNEIFKI